MSRRNIAVIAATMALTVTTLGTWQKIAPNFLRDLHAGDRDISVVYLLILAAFRLPQIVGGWLANRFGRKIVVIAPMFAVSVLYVLMAWVEDWPLFAALWVGVTVANAIQWPAMLSMIVESAPPENRGKVVGLMDACYFAGITLGPLAGAQLMESLGWPVAYLVVLSGIAYAVCSVWRLVGLKETWCPSRETSVEKGPSLRLLYVGFGVLTVGGYITYALTVEGPFLALFAEDVLRWSEPQINRLMACGAALSFAAAFVGGYLTDRFGMIRTFAFSGILTALLLVPLSLEAAAAPVVIALLFIPAEFSQVAFQKYMTTAVSESRRATFVGAVNTLIGLTAPPAVLLGGALYADSKGMPFWVAAAASLLSLAALPWLARAGKVRASSPA